MVVDHLEIEKFDENEYIVNNTVTKRYVKLGVREVNYLLLLKGKEQVEVTSEEYKQELDKNQKDILYKKFEQWNFLRVDKEYEKKKKDLSNIILVSFNSLKGFQFIISKLQVFISPIGFWMVIGSLLYFYYAINNEFDAILDGIFEFDFKVLDLLYIYVLSFIIAIGHEMFHVTACYKYSGKIAPIGIKLFYLIPAYFCDVSSMYMVKDKKKVTIVSVAGLAFNTFLANLSLFIYIFLYHNHMEGALFLRIFILNLGIILMNIIPFAKFDGYWIIKSLTGIDNLYDKSLLLIFTFILDIKKYKDVNMNISPTEKRMMTIYGLMIYVCHWLIWIYGIHIVRNRILSQLPFEINVMITLGVTIVALINCVKFTLRHEKITKKSIFMHQY